MNRTNDMNLDCFDEMISRYLKGQMSEVEEATFKQLLQDNDTFRNKAIATARLVQAMNQVGGENDKDTIKLIKNTSSSDVEKISAEASDTSTNRLRIFTLRKFVLSFSAAASILLCVFGGYKYYKYDQVTSLGSEYLTYFPASEFSRGERNDIENRLNGFYSNIETKSNLDTTIYELKTMWEESRSDLYNGYTEYMPEIGWLLTNAYLRNNDKSQALGVIELLINEYPEGTALGDKVRELKHKIENL
ncbi:MAG: hypothetical protein ACI3ZZ_04785 [Candidatus Aphodosoma sp.]